MLVRATHVLNQLISQSVNQLILGVGIFLPWSSVRVLIIYLMGNCCQVFFIVFLFGC